MKHDKDAIDHSFGVGSGIPTREDREDVYRAEAERADRSSNLRIADKPPRSWTEMLDAWRALAVAYFGRGANLVPLDASKKSPGRPLTVGHVRPTV